MRVLSGSGDNADNQAFLDRLKCAFPEREYRAAEAWIGSFLGYQQNWLLDTSRFSVLVKCRQIGASHAYAGAGVLWGLMGEETTVVSVGEREATEVLTKAALHAEGLAMMGSAWAKPVAQSKTRLTLASGGTVSAVPSTSGGRGRSGNVLLDEMAYYEHPQKVWDGASGTVMRGYRLRGISTPNGIGNVFHQVYTGADKLGYRKHRVTLQDAIADGLKINLDDCWKMARGDTRVYSQLFECAFLDGNFQYLPSGAVEECSVDDLYTFEGDYYAGLDIGRSNDLTVLIVVRKRSDGMRLVSYVETCKRTDSDGLDDMVARAFRRFDIKRLCVDATGMGTFPVDRMKKKHGKTRVEAVMFGLQSKEDLATGLYSAFTESTIRIPKTDQALANCPPGAAQKLRDDLCAIRRIITSAGNVRYDAPHTDEGHADRAWSLALALHACSGPSKLRHEIIPAGTQEIRLI